MNEIAYLRGMGYVKLSYYPSEYYPVCGYKANLNTYIDGAQVNVLETNKNWTEISIDGWIPRWYLTTKKPTIDDEVSYMDESQKRTIKDNCHLFLYLIKIVIFRRIVI